MSATAAALRSGFHRAVAGMISPTATQQQQAQAQQQQQQQQQAQQSQQQQQQQHRVDGGGIMGQHYAGQQDNSPLEDVDSVAFNMEFNLSLAPPPRDHVFWESRDANAWYLPLDPNVCPEIFQDESRVAEQSIITCQAHQRQVVDLAEWLQRLQHEAHGRLRCLFLVSRPRRPFNALGSDKTPSLAVSFSGPKDMVRQCRMMTMNNFPIMTSGTVSASVPNLMTMVEGTWRMKEDVLQQVEEIAQITRADIFLTITKRADNESQSKILSSVQNPDEGDATFHIFGDRLVEENARIRLLILLDRLQGLHIDVLTLELPLQPLVCGRQRKVVSNIQSVTHTTIYFPPRYPHTTEYIPRGGQRRPAGEIIISGGSMGEIALAKQKLLDQAGKLIPYFKEIGIEQEKVDEILLQRPEKLAKMSDEHAAFIMLNPIGRQTGSVRISAANVLNIERAARELMCVASQFYSAEWTVESTMANQLWPKEGDMMRLLCDLCIASRAEVVLSNSTFRIYGSDAQVKLALGILSVVPFIQSTVHSIKVKVELANEHKEFVSGKKNGKINKIMHLANVQILFDGFNEYDFHIVIRGPSYETIQHGLDLVEAEMPSSISFHVPDKYHKRIIGIGGTHIQSIMKKHSVFVKFSNAMDRGVNNYANHGQEEDIKVENVVCRTPTRNASSLDLVKNEIMDMVDSDLKEVIDEQLPMERWIHRSLLTQHRDQIEQIEKEHNCSVTFPSAEEAKDCITITGPEMQVHRVIDRILAMVSETHELSFAASPELRTYLASDECNKELIEPMHRQFPISLQFFVEGQPADQAAADTSNNVSLVFKYTRNNHGSVKDAIDFLVTRLVSHGLDAVTLKGMMPRPKSDSFEESLPFFEAKLLHRADPSIGTSSPTRPQFNEAEGSQSGLLTKIRKGRSVTSFFSDRHKRSNSPGSLFRHASSNASKASLISLESTGSGFRHPWNDSGINLNEEDHLNPLSAHGSNGHSAWGSSSAHSHFGSSSSTSKAPYVSNHPTTPGDATPTTTTSSHSRFGPPLPPPLPRASFDSGRPSTSQSFQGYPGPIGPPR